MLRRRLTSVVSRNLRRRFCAPATIQTTELPQKGDADPIPDFLTLSITSPSDSFLEDAQVRLVTVPGSGGAFGICPGHIPVLCELQPGVLSVYYEMGQTAGKQDHYFVSGGFALVHPNSVMEVAGVDICRLEDLDPNLISGNLTDARSKVQQAKTDTDKVEAEIEVSILEKISQVLTFGSTK